MKKEIIEAEMERVFPQFNKAEITAATMAAGWMQKHLSEKVLNWYKKEGCYKVYSCDVLEGLQNIFEN